MLLEIKDLTFYYHEDLPPVLDHVSLELDEGEIAILSGSSGCGKSTLARLIAGVEHQGMQSGTILFDGTKLSELQVEDRLTYVMLDFQLTSSFCLHTLREELIFIMNNMGLEEEEQNLRINELIHDLNIINLMDVPFLNLSEGEKQVAALACVLISKAKLCVLDEPFAHLDDDLADKLLVYLHKLRRKEKRSFLIIDHLVERWLDVCDVMIVMNKQGQLPVKHLNKANLDLYKNLFREENILYPYEHPIRYYHERSEEVLLELNDFNLQHKRVGEYLLKGVNLRVPKGAMIGIYGRSGVGKTTLLEALASGTGYEGQAYLNNWNLESLNCRQRNQMVGYIVQNIEDVFVRHRVIDEAIDYFESSEDDKVVNEYKASELLKKWDLFKYLDYNPYELSIGNGRRLLIALALCHNHDLILLDEPTYGQDATSTRQIMEVLKNLAQSGTSVIFVTHNKDLAKEYADIMYEFKDRTLKEVR